MNTQTAIVRCIPCSAVVRAFLMLLLTLGILLAPSAHGRAETYFDRPETYTAPTNVQTSVVVPSDYSGDGYPDLAFLAPSPYNNGVGLFALRINDQAGNFSTGTAPRAYSNLALTDAVDIDINADGRPDLAWATDMGYTGHVYYLSNPDFATRPHIWGGRALKLITAGDINADKYTDLATADEAGNLYLLSNLQGNGFTYIGMMQIGRNPQALLSADFNQDGLVDLAAANADNLNPGNRIVVLINDNANPGTTASFDIIETVLESVAPQKLITGDFNGDGFPDLAFNDAGSSSLYVSFNDGSGYIWDLSASLECGGSVGALAAGDLDGDGKQELICADAESNQIVVFFYDTGANLFNRFGETYPVGPGPRALFATDLNGDDKADLVSVNAGDNTISVLINHYEPVVDLTQLIEIGAVSTRKDYRLTPVKIGSPVYIDRPYAILDMSDGLKDGLLLQSANNDKWVRTDQHLQLRVRGEAVLMVCYDARARGLPSWLEDEGWIQTMEWIRSSDYRAGTLKVYMKTVSGSLDQPAEIWLGGNQAGGYTWARSNYYLVIQPRGFQPALPPVNINYVSTGKLYKVARLQKGERVYTDRSYGLIDHPQLLEGSVIVQSANNDRWVRDSRHLELSVKTDATVFACYDRRARRLPVWLTDGTWIPTDLRFSTTDRRAGPMTVMMRPVLEGETLILGGNHEGGDSRARSNYFLVIQPVP